MEERGWENDQHVEPEIQRTNLWFTDFKQQIQRNVFSLNKINMLIWHTLIKAESCLV